MICYLYLFSTAFIKLQYNNYSMVDKETVDENDGELVFELILENDGGTVGLTKVYELDDGRYIQKTSQSANPDSEWIEHDTFPDTVQTELLIILIETFENADMEITVNKAGVNGSELRYEV